MEMTNTAGDALRQAFMSKEDYAGLREEERVWSRLQKPLCIAAITVVWTGVVVSMMVMVDVVFAVSGQSYPFCQKRRLSANSMAPPARSEELPNFVYTEEEAVDAFWLVAFLPSSFVFVFATIYFFAAMERYMQREEQCVRTPEKSSLWSGVPKIETSLPQCCAAALAGISVAYTAPERHSCLRVVENDCCASRRGGVRCLSTLNLSFMITFVLLSIFMGIFILRLGTSCSIALFWCYEVACWGLIMLLGSTAFLLQRKAAVILDAGEYYGHYERGVELLEAMAITPEMEDRVAAGFKSWMGPAHSVLSDDEENNGGSSFFEGLDVDEVWEGDATEYLDAAEHLSKSSSMIG